MTRPHSPLHRRVISGLALGALGVLGALGALGACAETFRVPDQP